MVSQDGRDAFFNEQDTRKDFKEILAKRSDLVRYGKGRIVKPGSGSVTHLAGLVLGQITQAGPNQYRWAPYNPAATDGSQVAKGILAESVQVDSNDNGSLILTITGGAALYQDRLSGLDAAAITALLGKSYVEAGVNILELA
jgi:hypothetical protein